MFKKPLIFFPKTGAVFESSSTSSARNLFEFLMQDFLFSTFGVVRVK